MSKQEKRSKRVREWQEMDNTQTEPRGEKGKRQEETDCAACQTKKKAKLPEEVKSLDSDEDEDKEISFGVEDERLVAAALLQAFPPQAEVGLTSLIFAYCLDVIYLVGTDLSRIAVQRKFAQMSQLVASLSGAGDDIEIRVLSANRDVLELLEKYMRYHHDKPDRAIPKPLRSKDMHKSCPYPWDASFIDIPRQRLYDLISAANFLAIPSLVELGCAKVASLIKGQPLERIRDILAAP
eukprot:g24924.t1